jgi:hypothetical protein
LEKDGTKFATKVEKRRKPSEKIEFLESWEHQDPENWSKKLKYGRKDEPTKNKVRDHKVQLK